VGRFRVDIYRQRGTISIALRRVVTRVPDFGELNLPPVVQKLALEPRGLILVTGTTGSGKTTTIASMIDHINHNSRKHIVTIEDPIEILHRDQKSIINQREIGQDTENYKTALKYVLRQDPDIIFIGEMREEETVRTALTAAQTGHFVLSTLHTIDAAETINRIIDFFPLHQQEQVRVMLAGSLRGIISQRLLVRSDGMGRVPAVEVMCMTGRIRDLILDPTQTHLIQTAVAEGDFYGMQTFDQSLLSLYENGLIISKTRRWWPAIRRTSGYWLRDAGTLCRWPASVGVGVGSACAARGAGFRSRPGSLSWRRSCRAPASPLWVVPWA
jgi:twitching motility protein PilT